MVFCIFLFDVSLFFFFYYYYIHIGGLIPQDLNVVNVLKNRYV